MQTKKRSRRKIWGTVLSLWIIAAISSYMADIALPGLINFVDRDEFGCSGEKVADGIEIRPCVNSKKRGYSLPLLASYESAGAPFSIGLHVLDYNGNDVECQKIIVAEYALIVEGKRISLLQGGKAKSVPFVPYVGGFTAECYFEVPEATIPSTVSQIDVKTQVQIHTNEGVTTETISRTLKRGGWKGTWFIWEVLLTHA